MPVPLSDLYELGHEEVVLRHDPDAGYRAILALHSTALGPAVGGTRVWRYASPDHALRDALRLSRGMTYKNAVAGLALGGGKAVIMLPDGPVDRAALFRAHGRAVHALGGRFITAEDVGTTPADLEVAAHETPFVAGIAGKGGDPSPWTARGVFVGILACARFAWGTNELSGRTVAIQGVGSVGAALARALVPTGARLLLSDLDDARVRALAAELGAAVVSPDDILAAQADIFAPCAMGAVLDDASIPRLRATIVAGAANNQLAEPRHAAALAARGIVHAPDYVINAGGVISGSPTLLGETQDRMARRVDAIADTLTDLLARARREGITTAHAADAMAEQVLAAARRNRP
jgi:leucine dehydrogenase